MKNPFHSHAYRLALLLLAGSLLACTFSVPSFPSVQPGGKSEPAQISLPGGPGTLSNPGAGLADLKSYHVSFRQSVTGNLDGKPFERHTRLELTRVSGQADFIRELKGTDESASYFRTIMTGQAIYRWNTSDESCQGTAGELRPEEILEPAELLLPILQSSQVGPETVNQIPTIHYRFDQDALALAEPKPSITGEIWLAEPGGFLVKYTLEAAKPSKTTGTGLEAAQSWTYELSQVNTIGLLNLPTGCMPVPVDIPTLPDAINVSLSSGRLEYETASSASQVIDFYYDNLDPLGWTTTQAQPTEEQKVPVGLSFTNGDQMLSINLDQVNESGLIDVAFVIYNPDELAEADALAADATTTPAGPQPTIAPSASGLPADIPLYPGATNLLNLSKQGISFNVPDTPEQVANFYREQMTTVGWSLLNEFKDEMMVVQTWQKQDRAISLHISIADNITTVTIVFY